MPGGHVGGVKQQNYFPLGKSLILMQIYFCLLLQHGRRAQTLYPRHYHDILIALNESRDLINHTDRAVGVMFAHTQAFQKIYENT